MSYRNEWPGRSSPLIEGDRLDLADVATVSDLERFHRKAHPMCRFCDNDKLVVVEWGRSRQAPEEWMV